MGKEIVNQVQEAQRVPYRINPKGNMPRHILINYQKLNTKKKILKAAREKQQVTYKGILIRLKANLSAETLQARREWQDIFKVITGGASLVAQWLRVCLLMQGTWVRALVWEDPTCHGAAGPVSHNC